MRSRIKEELCSFYKDEAMLPGIVAEYENGFNEMILLNKAYALMLRDTGIITDDEAATLLKGLAKVHGELKPEDLDGQYEEFYFNVEHALFDRVPKEIAGKLHTGRSRNDIYATLWRMEARRSLLEICELVTEFRKELIAKAEANVDTVMTGYTHTQPAQPITLGHYYMAVADTLGRDLDRLRHCYRTTNLCPFGAAALAGTVFPIDRGILRDLLGFDDLLRNTLDAVGTRDYQLEILSALSIMSVTLSRVAHDHYIWTTDEFNAFEISGQLAICSSIMPQKKNPGALETSKAKAALVLGSLTAALASLKNTPFSLCLDLFEVSEPYWSACHNATLGLKLLKETLKRSTYNTDVMFERTKHNFSTVTALADHMVKTFGISFVSAHAIVGRMVALVHADGSLMNGMTVELLHKVSEEIIGKPLDMTADDLAKVLDPLENVHAKITYGGPGRDSVLTMIGESKLALAAEQEWLRTTKRKVQDAYADIATRELQLTEGR